MSSDLVFPMGLFEARFPADRRYSQNHMWGSLRDGSIRFGFTAYAVRLMMDVYFLEWQVDAGAHLEHRQEIGAIESKKAESSLYAPIAGRLVRFNEELLNDPSAINLDGYGAGWLFEMDGEFEQLLSPPGYVAHLAATWESTQKTIRGKLNER